MKIKEMAVIALLAALITVTGLFKIPGIVAGTEFQLSSVIAVAIGGVFGFKRYITAGILSSIIGFMLGWQNFFNVIIAMTFRVVVGLVLMLGVNPITIIACGPIGTIAGRCVLAEITDVPVVALIATAAVGMAYTAIFAYPTYLFMKKIALQANLQEFMRTPKAKKQKMESIYE